MSLARKYRIVQTSSPWVTSEIYESEWEKLDILDKSGDAYRRVKADITERFCSS